MGNHNDANNNNLNEPPDQLIEVNQPEEEIDNRIKSIITVKNPFYLIKESISLEKDSIENIYYIKFKYDSLINFDCYINFKTKKNKTRKHLNKKDKYELCYLPIEQLAEKQILIKNLEKGKNIEFFNKEAFFKLEYFEENNEQKDEEIYDISIEFTPIYEKDSENENEIIFVSLCELENNHDELGIKCVCQKLKKHKFWFELKDIYDGAGTNGKCVICYSNFRNTIFLSCRHSCCCQKCSASLYPKDCPLCKNKIKEIIVLDNDKSVENEKSVDNEKSVESDKVKDNNNEKINDINKTEDNINLDENHNIQTDEEEIVVDDNEIV